MSEDQPQKKKRQSQQKKQSQQKQQNQTEELKDLLEDLDSESVPKLKTTTYHVVDEPSFLKSEKLKKKTGIPKSQGLYAPSKPNKVIPIQKMKKIPEVKVEKRVIQDPTGNFWKDTEVFFKQLENAYVDRYKLWEKTFTSILNILEKMKQYSDHNTGIVLKSLDEIEKKVIVGLDNFKKKRFQVQKFSDVDFNTVSKNFKRTLDLLGLQLKEFRLQSEINELYKIFSK